MKIYENKKKEIIVDLEFPIPHERLKLKISARPDSWETLYALSLQNPQYLGNLIYIHFAKPAHNYINRSRSRGIQSGRENFMSKMKELIPPVYYWIAWWLREHRERWPKGLVTLVNEIESSPENISGRRKMPKAHEITAFLFERHHGKERKKHGLLKWTDDPDRFRRIFISNNEFAKIYKTRPKEYFLRDSTFQLPKAI